MTNRYTSLYNHVIKYEITAKCIQPLHIGSGRDGKILIHPVKNVPFIQATGMTGALRDYLTNDVHLQKQLFGTSAGDATVSESGSHVKVSDAFFDVVNTELRPRVKINRETGTCQAVATKGSGRQSGQKFETESISTGAIFAFQIYLYEREHELEESMESILAAIHSGAIQIGGQKSNGCGVIAFTEVLKSDYDMTKSEDRKSWSDESKVGVSILKNLKNISDVDSRLRFELKAQVDSTILIKSIAVRKYDDEAPDAEQMRDSNGKLLIPATSIKGVLRSQMEKIARYNGFDDDIIETIFGRTSEGEQKGFLGKIHFYDSLIEGDSHLKQTRIHIDKYTGGVMYGALFAEDPVFGDLTICVDLDDDDKKTAGLLLMTLRDLGIGIISLGSGSNIGRGYIDGKSLQIKQGGKSIAEIDLRNKKIVAGESFIAEYMRAAKGEVKR